MEPLQGHPAESGQHGVVKRKGYVNAKPIGGQCCHRLTREEVQVEEDQSNGKADVDLHRDVCSGFPVRERSIDLW